MNFSKRLKAAWLAFWHPEVVSIIDSVSGAFAKPFLIVLAGQEIAKAKRGQKMSLVFIDADGLKEVNDRDGHDAGDKFIRQLVDSVRMNIREYDLIGRWGGDEFVILFQGISSIASERIDAVWRKFPNFSWGVAEWEKGDDLQSLVKRADLLMYQQKKGKKQSASIKPRLV